MIRRKEVWKTLHEESEFHEGWLGGCCHGSNCVGFDTIDTTLYTSFACTLPPLSTRPPHPTLLRPYQTHPPPPLTLIIVSLTHKSSSTHTDHPSLAGDFTVLDIRNAEEEESSYDRVVAFRR